MNEQIRTRRRWTRAILLIAIILVIAFAFGGIWPYLIVGFSGMIAGYAFGFAEGERFGREYAFKFLFGDEIQGVHQEHFDNALRESAEKRDDNSDVDELIALFRTSAAEGILGAKLPKAGGRVRQETAAELQKMREDGLN